MSVLRSSPYHTPLTQIRRCPISTQIRHVSLTRVEEKLLLQMKKMLGREIHSAVKQGLKVIILRQNWLSCREIIVANEENAWQRNPFCSRIGFEGHYSAVELVVLSTRSRKLFAHTSIDLIGSAASSALTLRFLHCTSLPRIPNPRSLAHSIHACIHSLRSVPPRLTSATSGFTDVKFVAHRHCTLLSPVDTELTQQTGGRE